HFPEPARRFFGTFFADDLPVRAGGRRDSSASSSSDAELSAAARSANSSSSGGSSTTNGLLHLGQGIFLPAAPRFLSLSFAPHLGHCTERASLIFYPRRNCQLASGIGRRGRVARSIP